MERVGVSTTMQEGVRPAFKTQILADLGMYIEKWLTLLHVRGIDDFILSLGLNCLVFKINTIFTYLS